MTKAPYNTEAFHADVQEYLSNLEEEHLIELWNKYCDSTGNDREVLTIEDIEREHGSTCSQSRSVIGSVLCLFTHFDEDSTYFQRTFDNRFEPVRFVQVEDIFIEVLEDYICSEEEPMGDEYLNECIRKYNEWYLTEYE